MPHAPFIASISKLLAYTYIVVAAVASADLSVASTFVLDPNANGRSKPNSTLSVNLQFKLFQLHPRSLVVNLAFVVHYSIQLCVLRF